MRFLASPILVVLLLSPAASATTFFTDPVDQFFSGAEITGGSAGFDALHLFLSVDIVADSGSPVVQWGLDSDRDLSTGQGTVLVSNLGHEIHGGELSIIHHPLTDGASAARVIDTATSSVLGHATVTTGPGTLTIAIPYGPNEVLRDPVVLFSVAGGGVLAGNLISITDVAPSGGSLTATPVGPATPVPEPAIALLLGSCVLAASRRAS
jgi:hypothetical protein